MFDGWVLYKENQEKLTFINYDYHDNSLSFISVVYRVRPINKCAEIELNGYDVCGITRSDKSGSNDMIYFIKKENIKLLAPNQKSNSNSIISKFTENLVCQ